MTALGRSDSFGAARLPPSALIAMAYLDQFLSVIVDQGGSDLHIGEGQPPKMRKQRAGASPPPDVPINNKGEIAGARLQKGKSPGMEAGLFQTGSGGWGA